MVNKLILALYVAVASAAIIAVKWGTKSGSLFDRVDNHIHINLNAFVLGGFALYGLSFLLYMYLISKYDLGYIIPTAAAFVYVLIFVASYLIFKESFTALKISGIALIIGGLVLLNIK